MPSSFTLTSWRNLNLFLKNIFVNEKLNSMYLYIYLTKNKCILITESELILRKIFLR